MTEQRTIQYLEPQVAKPAQTAVPIHPLIAQRWSPRAFADRPVDREDVLSLVEAARWAPSSFNEQPWRFVVGLRGDDTHAKLASTLYDGNATWASKAPVLMLSVAKTTFDADGRENPHARHDVGLAVATLTTQATSLGLVVHQMGASTPRLPGRLSRSPRASSRWPPSPWATLATQTRCQTNWPSRRSSPARASPPPSWSTVPPGAKRPAS